MTLLLHAIVPAEPVAIEAPLVAVPAGPLIGYASGDGADMHEHHRRVMLLHERFSACLPARFGSSFADEQALRALLTEQQAALCAALGRVRGRCELAVSAVWLAAPAVPDATPGRRYLLERQQRERIAGEMADAVERVAGAADARRALNPRPGLALSLALLVERDAAAETAEQIVRIDGQGRVRILVSGPWAPYSFVGRGTREKEE